jgi:hypothetical protein
VRFRVMKVGLIGGFVLDGVRVRQVGCREESLWGVL